MPQRGRETERDGERGWTLGHLRLEPVDEQDAGLSSSSREAEAERQREAQRDSSHVISHGDTSAAWASQSDTSRRPRRRPSIGTEPQSHAASRMPHDMVLRLQQYEHDDQELRAAAVRELRDWFQRQERRHCPNEAAKRALVATRFAGPDDLGAAYRWVVQHLDELGGQAKSAGSAWAPLWRWVRELLEPWEPASKLERENYRLWATERKTQQFWEEFADPTVRHAHLFSPRSGHHTKPDTCFLLSQFTILGLTSAFLYGRRPGGGRGGSSTR
jgi:hypothetical protein